MSGSIWTPTRESASTLAFMATLRLHSPQWQWVEAPEQARWWVIDAAAVSDLEALAAQYDRLADKPRVAFLAPQLGQLPRPSWTFFKPPVKSGLIFNWVRPQEAAAAAIARAAARSAPNAGNADAAPQAPGVERAAWASRAPRTAGARTESPAPAATATLAPLPPWQQGRLRLRRWPNMSRYGSALELTVACSRLLAAPASWTEIRQWSVSEALLERLLEDAHREGLLSIEPTAQGLDAPAARAGASAPLRIVEDAMATGAATPAAAASAAPGAATRAALAPGAAATEAAATEAAAPPAAERSRWDLVKRLLGKFAPR